MKALLREQLFCIFLCLLKAIVTVSTSCYRTNYTKMALISLSPNSAQIGPNRTCPRKVSPSYCCMTLSRIWSGLFSDLMRTNTKSKLDPEWLTRIQLWFGAKTQSRCRTLFFVVVLPGLTVVRHHTLRLALLTCAHTYTLVSQMQTSLSTCDISTF